MNRKHWQEKKVKKEQNKKTKKKIIYTMSSRYLIYAGLIDNNHYAQIEPLLSHTAKKQRHKSKLRIKLLTGC